MLTKRVNQAIISLIIVLIIDLLVPLGVAVGVLYIACIVLLVRESPKYIILFSLFASLLILIVPLITGIFETSWMVYVNRIISIISIAIVCVISIKYKKLDDITDNYIVELEKKNKEQEQFIYIASHDLQEPLRTVSNYAGFLNKRYNKQLDTTGKKSLTFMLQATNRMSQLIKGLLDYSRIGRKIESIIIDCNQLVEEVLVDINTIVLETNTIIDVDFLPKINGYEVELRILFQNLILNAIKFRKEGIAPQIKISSKSNEEYWIFSIQDNGIGIDAQHFEKIFSMFQQLNDRKTYKGSGIGLAQCQKIMDIHNGKIWVESELNIGSTFYFNIPKVQTDGKKIG